MIGVPFLAATAAAIGNTRSVRIKPGWPEPSVLFAGTISKTGTAKTPSLSYAQAPLEALQSEAHLRYENELISFKEAEQAAKGTKDGKRRGPRLETPVRERLTTTDTTMEALAHALTRSAGVLNTRDELSGFMESMDAYRKGGDRDSWLQIWSGKSLDINRKTTDAPYIPKPAVSIVGGIQPDRVGALADPEGRQDGFIARWLLTYPDVGIRRWNDNETDPDRLVRMINVFRRLRYPKGYANPVALPLSTEARALFAEWHDENADVMETAQPLAVTFYAKYPAYVARFALILHVLANPDDLVGPIEAPTVGDAIALMEYFRASLIRILPLFHAKAVAETVGVLPRVRRLLDRAAGAWVDRTAINQGLGGYVKSDAIAAALESLRGDGLAEMRTLPAGPAGGRPKELWRSVTISPDPAPEKPEKPEKRTTARKLPADHPEDVPEQRRKNVGNALAQRPDPGEDPTPYGSPLHGDGPLDPRFRVNAPAGEG
jgi:hypothetical protein